MARSPLARLEELLKRLVGPAQLGRADEPSARQQQASREHRAAHEQAWETVVDSTGRRYVRARRGGPEDRAGGATGSPAPAGHDDGPAAGRGSPEPGGPAR